MRRIAFLLVSLAAMIGVAASMAPASGNADEEAAPWVKEKPAGYRDWKWVSSAHEAGKLNSLGAVNADGKPVDAAFMKPCFPCHQQNKSHDLVFTTYAP